MDRTIRVGVIGLGNCAVALMHGVAMAKAGDYLPGVITETIGGHEATDLDFVVAFDVDQTKVGKTIAAAATCGQNSIDITYPLPFDGPVLPGPVMDGVGEKYRARIEIVDEDVEAKVEKYAGLLIEHGVEVLVNYLPVGAEDASRFWAEVALTARVAFFNAIPVFIGSDTHWIKRFADAGVVLIGDDIKSQYGATLVHRVLTHALVNRGYTMKRTYQLNVGGNMDFVNLMDSGRLETKRQSKTEAVVAEAGEGLSPFNIHISPSDYVPWLGDTKVALIRIEAEGFGGAPMILDCRLEVQDSPNSAGVALDVIRYAKTATEMGDTTAIGAVAALYMKRPPAQLSEDLADELIGKTFARTFYGVRSSF